jgi:hypothetical protein
MYNSIITKTKKELEKVLFLVWNFFARLFCVIFFKKIYSLFMFWMCG